MRALSLRVLAIVLMPAALGGCACFTPVLKAADSALTAMVPGAAPERPEPPRAAHRARVKGYVHAEPQARSRPGPARKEAAETSRRKPGRAAMPNPAMTADEADAAAVAAVAAVAEESERLALAETAARMASEKAVAEAHAMMLKGEVQSARQRLVAAMNGSNALVVLAFARTFDPNELAKLAKSDAQPDPSRAQALYEHARQLGSKDADAALKRLSSSLPKAPQPPQPGAQPAAGAQKGNAAPAPAGGTPPAR